VDAGLGSDTAVERYGEARIGDPQPAAMSLRSPQMMQRDASDWNDRRCQDLHSSRQENRDFGCAAGGGTAGENSVDKRPNAMTREPENTVGGQHGVEAIPRRDGPPDLHHPQRGAVLPNIGDVRAHSLYGYRVLVQIPS